MNLERKILNSLHLVQKYPTHQLLLKSVQMNFFADEGFCNGAEESVRFDFRQKFVKHILMNIRASCKKS